MPRARFGMLLLAYVAVVAVVWLLVTDDVRVWPVRNTLQYRALRWWWSVVGEPQSPSGPTGTLRGTVSDERAQPITGAHVLVARWDGTTFSARSDDHGRYVISGIPAGSYAPVAGAPGFQDAVVGNSALAWPPALAGLTRQPISIARGQTRTLDVRLRAESPAEEVSFSLQMGEFAPLSCDQPISGVAQRATLAIRRGGRREAALYYIPTVTPSAANLPLLLTVYPGSADEWECASVPLAAAGYAVVALGPAYGFDLEQDVEDLRSLISASRRGEIPQADPSRIVLLGGSYSALHVMRFLERPGQDARAMAAVLLGPPADLFDMRRRYEDGSFIPPFGLDQALVALGLPDRAPMRYWRYSGAYHISATWPPIFLVHSRDDAVVPYQQSEQLAAALSGAGVPHQLHVFDAAGHYLLAEGGQAEVIYRLVLQFLAERTR